MRHTLVLVVGICLVFTTTLSAEVVLRPHDPAAAERPLKAASALAQKLDTPDDIMIVPFYEVDTTDPSGTATLYAVRNISTEELDLDIEYYTQDGTLVRDDLESVDPRATLSVNIRDVGGLPVDGDGFTRGFVILGVDNTPMSTENLVGDYFQVDVGDAFATGDRLLGFADIACAEAETRFLDFGSGTKLRIFNLNPQGADPDTDPPSFTVSVVDESGAAFAATDVYTDIVSLTLSASDFTFADFGTLIFDFTNSTVGYVFAEYSAGGLFSVGVNSACVMPLGGP